MARMVPDRVRDATKSAAERKLFDVLREGLPNDYTVFHHVAWLARNLRGDARDGETDFVIAHPVHGLLVVEVKGGRIAYDGLQGQWTSNQYAIKDPFEQASSAKFSLLAKIRDLPRWRAQWPTVGHAVAFPDVAVTHDLRLDAPQAIVCDVNNLAAIDAWVNGAFTYWQSQGAYDGVPGVDGIKELVRLLSPTWELHAPLAAAFADEEALIIRLTEDQFDLLDFLSDRRRVAISGCAGSGKTTMAVEEAKRLAQQGFRVLLTCFNRNLAAYIRSDESLPPAVAVFDYHALCLRMAERARLNTHPGPGGRTQAWYEDTLPDLLMAAAEKLGPQYDAIVVDEGQDFLPHWWVALQSLLTDPDRDILYIFYDDNQNLYQRSMGLPAGLETFSLNTNCRNTQHIHRTVLPFYRANSQPRAKGPLGRPPEIGYYTADAELKQQLRQALHRLIVQEQIPNEDIVVLTPRARDKSLLWQWGSLGNYRFTDQWPASSGEIYANNVYQFKGLESPVIILVEVYPSSHMDLEKILYVGCSRARNHLVVLAEAALPADIRSRLPGAT